jgi:hypothetical protein
MKDLTWRDWLFKPSTAAGFCGASRSINESGMVFNYQHTIEWRVLIDKPKTEINLLSL